MELKEEKKGGRGNDDEGEKEAGSWREGQELEEGVRERERDLVKNGHPAREDSLGLRRAMRPCSGRDSFLGRELRTRPVIHETWTNRRGIVSGHDAFSFGSRPISRGIR